MIRKTLYRSRLVYPLNEIASLIDKPYNKPNFSDAQTVEHFRAEYEQADSLVRLKLKTLGEIDAFGEKEFSMGSPWNNSRKIGVTINAEWLFNKKTLELLKTVVNEMLADYLIILSGEYESGGGMFYICITKNEEVLGYAPNKKMLEPFGFA